MDGDRIVADSENVSVQLYGPVGGASTRIPGNGFESQC